MIKNDKLLSEMARARMIRLVELAKIRVEKTGDTDLIARRYINIAKSIKSHYEIKEPSLNRMLCKKCGSMLMPGLNARVRVSSHNGYMAIVCGKCGAEKHSFYK
ncbi:MAG: ribonuclease P [Candidatus Micrarchaeota archaeon]|nr:ribonuclease P [Candidatus Micrarchaeota archaeon]MDE1834125.1 ribonuclease P [Candidatus Micrarchaeota archaeon]MDE1859930.1 ribonuclease P [Candidatus Micrarchaeota archaeon]